MLMTCESCMIFADDKASQHYFVYHLIFLAKYCKNNQSWLLNTVKSNQSWSQTKPWGINFPSHVVLHAWTMCVLCVPAVCNCSVPHHALSFYLSNTQNFFFSFFLSFNFLNILCIYISNLIHFPPSSTLPPPSPCFCVDAPTPSHPLSPQCPGVLYIGETSFHRTKGFSPYWCWTVPSSGLLYQSFLNSLLSHHFKRTVFHALIFCHSCDTS